MFVVYQYDAGWCIETPQEGNALNINHNMRLQFGTVMENGGKRWEASQV